MDTMGYFLTGPDPRGTRTLILPAKLPTVPRF